MGLVQRRSFLFAAGATLAAPRLSLAQREGKVWRIGFLAMLSPSTPSSPNVYYDAFAKRMHELGYIEGKNLKIEWRFAEGRYDRLPALAAELARLQVDVVVTHATAGTRAAQRATKMIPIVTAAVVEPVKNGFAASLARPGSNITGLTVDVGTALIPKRIELLRSAIPKLTRLGVVLNPDSTGPELLKEILIIGQRDAFSAVPAEVRTLEDIERGFSTMKREHAEGVIVLPDGFLLGQAQPMAELALRSRLPMVTPWREHVAAGALMSYGQDIAESFRSTASIVAKILKGARPSEMPFEQPTRMHLAINLKTAKALGIEAQRTLLLRADEVIQ